MEDRGIADFFKGRSVFITGASGFMGKVLVEKLLRSCPGIPKIYALLRQGKFQSIEEKLAKIRSYEIFDKLKKEQPGDLESKLVAIRGDVTELGLGLSVKDRSMLIKNVSIVFNFAATVQFNQALRDALIMNVRGPREVCELVLDMRKETPNTYLIHISTAYAHTDRDIIEEHMYPAHADWRQALQIAETMDDLTLQIISEKYMNGFPNTYTFTKSLAETAVNDLCGPGGCTVIIRPSIVISSVKEPIKGWIDNFNGPVAMLVAGGTGIVRINYLNPDVHADYMAVDCAIKGIILATWRQHYHKRQGTSDPTNCEVYNCAAHKTLGITMGEMISLGKDFCDDVPLKDCLWYPSTSTTMNLAWYYINFMIFHMIPAVVLDTIFKTFKIKQRSLVKVQRKIYSATMALSFFISRDWEFLNMKLLQLEEEIPPSELETFGYDVENIDIKEYFKDALIGGKKYLLKEDLGNLDKERARLKTLYYLDNLVRFVFYALTLWYFFVEWNVPFLFYDRLYNYVSNL